MITSGLIDKNQIVSVVNNHSNYFSVLGVQQFIV
jgi:hypothetical protein